MLIKCYKHPVTPSIRVAVCALQVEAHTSIDLLCSIVPIVITWRVSGSAGITGPTIEDTTYLSRAFVFFKQLPQKTKVSSFEQKPTIGLHGWVFQKTLPSFGWGSSQRCVSQCTGAHRVREGSWTHRGTKGSPAVCWPAVPREPWWFHQEKWVNQHVSTNNEWCFSQQTWHLLTSFDIFLSSFWHLLTGKNGFNIASTSNDLERKQLAVCRTIAAPPDPQGMTLVVVGPGSNNHGPLGKILKQNE